MFPKQPLECRQPFRRCTHELEIARARGDGALDRRRSRGREVDAPGGAALDQRTDRHSRQALPGRHGAPPRGPGFRERAAGADTTLRLHERTRRIGELARARHVPPRMQRLQPRLRGHVRNRHPPPVRLRPRRHGRGAGGRGGRQEHQHSPATHHSDSTNLTSASRSAFVIFSTRSLLSCASPPCHRIASSTPSARPSCSSR
jgi:hypothetical protein